MAGDDTANEDYMVAGGMFAFERAFEIGNGVIDYYRIYFFGRTEFATGVGEFIAVFSAMRAEIQGKFGHIFIWIGYGKAFFLPYGGGGVSFRSKCDCEHRRIAAGDHCPADCYGVGFAGVVLYNGKDYLFWILGLYGLFVLGFFLHF